MSTVFDPITVEIAGVTTVFDAIGNGKYMNTTLNFGDPQDYIKVTPGSKGKDGRYSMTVTRHKESDNLDGTTEKYTVVLQCFASDGIPASDLHLGIRELNDFLTSDGVSKILQGAS